MTAPPPVQHAGQPPHPGLRLLPDHRQASPLRTPAAWATLLGIAALGLTLDLATKWLAFRTIAGQPVVIEREQVLRVSAAGRSLQSLVPHHEPVIVIPGVLNLTLVLNPGAVFGIGAGHRWFFITFTLAALGVALWMFAAWTRPHQRWAHAALGLLIAGGLGNLYDRLRFACVRDFLHPLPDLRFPFGWRMPLTGEDNVWPYVSNLADLLLLIGIGMLMWFLWRSGTPAHAGAPVQPR